MSTTVNYKGVDIATASNDTVILSTKGTWMEDDLTLTDVSGGGTDTYTWYGKNPVFSGENELVYTLSETSWPSWTPSTTSATIKNSGETLIQFQEPDLSQHDVAIIYSFSFKPVYVSGASMAAAAIGYQYRALIFRGMRFSSYNDFITGTPGTTATNTASDGRLFYYTTKGVATAASSTYSVYSSSTPSQTLRSGIISVTTPSVTARCNSSYFSTTAASKIDASASTITFRAKVYFVDKFNPWLPLQQETSDELRGI